MKQIDIFYLQDWDD